MGKFYSLIFTLLFAGLVLFTLPKHLFAQSAPPSIPQSCPANACADGLSCKEGNCVQCGGEEIFAPVEQSALREYARKRGILVGSAAQSSSWEKPSGNLLSSTLAKEFNAVEMYMQMNHFIWNREQLETGNFDFRKIDKVISFARQHNQRVLGTTLIYRNELVPSWLNFDKPDCGGWSRSELTDIMQKYIKTVLSYAKDDVYGWVEGGLWREFYFQTGKRF